MTRLLDGRIVPIVQHRVHLANFSSFIRSSRADLAAGDMLLVVYLRSAIGCTEIVPAVSLVHVRPFAASVPSLNVLPHKRDRAERLSREEVNLDNINARIEPPRFADVPRYRFTPGVPDRTVVVEE